MCYVCGTYIFFFFIELPIYFLNPFMCTVDLFRLFHLLSIIINIIIIITININIIIIIHIIIFFFYNLRSQSYILHRSTYNS